MDRVFSIAKPFRVPDGTLVSPFLKPADSESGLPPHLVRGVSLAAGTIDPRFRSKIHVMPFTAQVTFVRNGHLTVVMKGPQDGQPHELELAATQAALTEPGVLFQLINNHPEPCEVLYIVSPACLFVTQPDGRVLYDDSVVLDEDWSDLANAGWRISRPTPPPKHRSVAKRRLSRHRAAKATAGTA